MVQNEHYNVKRGWLATDKQQRQHAIPNCKATKTPLYSLVQRASGATR